MDRAMVRLPPATDFPSGSRCLRGFDSYRPFGPFVSDDQGLSRCPDAVLVDEVLDQFDRWIQARVPGQRIGVARAVLFTGPDANLDHRVVLAPSRTVEGRIIVPEGF